jgi:predicted GNAT family N-acyltransferase
MMARADALICIACPGAVTDPFAVRQDGVVEHTSGAEKPADVVIERVPADRTLPLRQKVLRPHQSLDEVRFMGDDDPRAAHFVARRSDGEVIGVVSLMAEPAPWDPSSSAWRLRGMATDPAVRGERIGAALLAAVVGEAEQRGGGPLWCAARHSAIGFYEKGGWITVGEPWEEPTIGPHIAMRLRPR